MDTFERFNDSRINADAGEYENSISTHNSTFKRKKHPKINKVIVCVLLALLLMCLLYIILVHPINKLKLSLLIAKDCTINVSVVGGGNTNIYIDDNFMFVEAENAYYKIEGNYIYKYHTYSGKWSEPIGVDNYLQEEMFLDFEKAFDRKNYEYRGYPFVWYIKEGVDMGELKKVRFGFIDGRFSFGGYYNSYKVVISFYGIGTTEVELPDKKQ